MNLTGYMIKKTSVRNRPDGVVNCYDQAAAVCSFGTLLGIDVKYRYMEPFGYINTINLVGVGNCNNPFYQGNSSGAVVATNSVQRTGFGNHAFAVFNGYVFDACAGPALGTQTEAQYVSDTIDVSRGRSGSVSNISTRVVTGVQ